MENKIIDVKDKRFKDFIFIDEKDGSEWRVIGQYTNGNYLLKEITCYGYDYGAIGQEGIEYYYNKWENGNMKEDVYYIDECSNEYIEEKIKYYVIEAIDEIIEKVFDTLDECKEYIKNVHLDEMRRGYCQEDLTIYWVYDNKSNFRRNRYTDYEYIPFDELRQILKDEGFEYEHEKWYVYMGLPTKVKVEYELDENGEVDMDTFDIIHEEIDWDKVENADFIKEYVKEFLKGE